MNAAPTTGSNAALSCHICPRKPDFSDISHLLTHVASKGHLSNYFKMKVKADEDPVAKRTLDYYDAWYDENNLQELLRERMALKDRKKGGAGAATSRRPSTGELKRTLGQAFETDGVPASTSSRSTPASSAALPALQQLPRRSSKLRENLLDPQLERRVKAEPLSRSVTPTAFLQRPVDLRRAYAPHVQHWVETSFEEMPIELKQESSENSPSEYSLFESMTTHQSDRRDFSGLPSESLAYYFGEDHGEPEPITDIMIPKGVQWPGMAMFDSATADMKRKRNQKKSTNVVKQLQATSEVIEPNELVFDAEGTHRKTRLITGEPESSDSLIEGESEPEVEAVERKRPRRRTRQPLTEKNVNTCRPSRKRTAAPLPTSRVSRGPYFDGVHGDEDHEDDILTYGDHKPTTRTGISVLRDNSGPDITFEPPSLSYLTSAFRPSSRPGPQFSHSNSHAVNPRAQPRLTSWKPFDHPGAYHPMVNRYHSRPPSYGSFGQFLNLGAQGNNPFVNGNQGQHQQYHFSSLGNEMFPFDLTDHGDNLTDIFGLGQDLDNMNANPLLGLHVGADLGHNNPLFLDRTTREEDEATISAKSER
jgi:hypothetical protein